MMRRSIARPARPRPLFIFLVLVLRACGAAVADEPAFTVEALADGVHLFRPAAARTDLTNALVVERGDGLLVVESQPTPEAAREFLAALRSVSDAPPRYLVLSHPHAESAGGASAFPGQTMIIGTDGCRTALEDPEFDFGAEARLRWTGPEAWDDPPRVTPTLLLHARTILDDPVRPVELLPLSRSHTSGDLMVWLPEENLYYAGAVFAFDRNPYAADGYVAGWIAILNSVAKNRPSILVPLRGPAADVRELRATRDAFAWMRGRIDIGFVDGLDAGRIPAAVLGSDGIEERFDLEASPNFVRGLIERSVAEAVKNRQRRGYE